MNYIFITCPYCGVTTRYELRLTTNREDRVLLCYPVEGGCDQKFAVTVRLKPVVEAVYKLEIEQD